MGAFISTAEEPSSSSSPPMSASASQTQSEPESGTEPQSQSDSKPVDDVAPEIVEEEEEQEECGFCLFMKGGGCKESFVAWENCIEEAENSKEDIADKCYDVTSKLRECMLAHPDYYDPILRAEKAAEELDKDKENEAVIEVDAEKAEESPKHHQ